MKVLKVGCDTTVDEIEAAAQNVEEVVWLMLRLLYFASAHIIEQQSTRTSANSKFSLKACISTALASVSCTDELDLASISTAFLIA